MKPLAVVMIVKNVEADLEKCFSAFRKNGLDPDFHLFDTGSTDDTIYKAENLGAIVKKLPKVSSFAMSRNSAFHKVLYESTEIYKWFMYIDADEEITPFLAKGIKDFVESEETYINYDAAYIHNDFYREISYDSRLSILKASLGVLIRTSKKATDWGCILQDSSCSKWTVKSLQKWLEMI